MPDIVLAGSGLIHDATALRLSESWTVIRPPSDAPACAAAGAVMFVTVSDTWENQDREPAREACRAAGLPWLPVRTELGRVLIGPVERAGAVGCLTCCDFRRGRGSRAAVGDGTMRERHARVLTRTPSPWLTALGCETVAAMVAGEAHAVAAGAPEHPRTEHALVSVALDTLAVTVHRFLPDPKCPTCGGLPDDTPDLAKMSLSALPKPSPTTYRLARPDPDELFAAYVDRETGLIGEVIEGESSGLATASALAGVRHVAYMAGHGRAGRARDSRAVAVLEALERYAGFEPNGTNPAVRGSYAELRSDALDPRSLGTHAPTQYAAKGFPYRPFREDAVCDWVWGHSFARERPILVPASVAYYGPGRDRPFFYPCSNGCAIGGRLEEAVLHAILETAERDAFLMTWHAALSVPALDLRTARDPKVALLGAAMEARTGYRLRVHDITLEHGVPCVWAMAIGPPGGPRSVSVGAAHPDPCQAVAKALGELAVLIPAVEADHAANGRRASLMAERPEFVQRPSDHALLHAAPEAFPRLAFLTEAPEGRPFHEGFGARFPPLRHDDLRDDLTALAGRYLETGMDVIVVDQTTPEHRARDLACARVLIPGTLPMTFGHDNRRLDNLPRLTRVAYTLGHSREPLAPDALNLCPHPFP
ncbi:TOMM precursor leader peptide-binding protein [Nonomuraea mesophila]|uniref:TOMM leader peptide-binding protein n=1 Tax=Nonomuraea mesophila TaxID=2530382 RepID=A0A4R5FII1_9ACTN|nr:TOMM precursor leader peptide-binding protein [Nonomuraea mesophila]TDE51535.1 TOMM precursor leader peptide-binding protein [Nonomuraea mesophila]